LMKPAPSRSAPCPARGEELAGGALQPG
jgi:hypothetical protein